MPIEAHAFTLAPLRDPELELIPLADCGVLLGFLENEGVNRGHFVVSLW
jgi:hypothetical protein